MLQLIRDPCLTDGAALGDREAGDVYELRGPCGGTAGDVGLELIDESMNIIDLPKGAVVKIDGRALSEAARKVFLSASEIPAQHLPKDASEGAAVVRTISLHVPADGNRAAVDLDVRLGSAAWRRRRRVGCCKLRAR